MTDDRRARSRTGVAGAVQARGELEGDRRGPLPYSDVIRRRWRQPRFRGELAGANRTAEDVNPLCGDRVRVMLRVDDDTVRTARFVGDSCAICTASADVVAEMVEGRPAHAGGISVRDVLDVLAADIRPTRMRCVTLPLSVLDSALDGERSPAAAGSGDPRGAPLSRPPRP